MQRLQILITNANDIHLRKNTSGKWMKLREIQRELHKLDEKAPPSGQSRRQIRYISSEQSEKPTTKVDQLSGAGWEGLSRNENLESLHNKFPFMENNYLLLRLQILITNAE